MRRKPRVARNQWIAWPSALSELEGHFQLHVARLWIGAGDHSPVRGSSETDAGPDDVATLPGLRAADEAGTDRNHRGDLGRIVDALLGDMPGAHLLLRRAAAEEARAAGAHHDCLVQGDRRCRRAEQAEPAEHVLPRRLDARDLATAARVLRRLLLADVSEMQR